MAWIQQPISQCIVKGSPPPCHAHRHGGYQIHPRYKYHLLQEWCHRSYASFFPFIIELPVSRTNIFCGLKELVLISNFCGAGRQAGRSIGRSFLLVRKCSVYDSTTIKINSTYHAVYLFANTVLRHLCCCCQCFAWLLLVTNKALVNTCTAAVLYLKAIELPCPQANQIIKVWVHVVHTTIYGHCM